MHVLHCEPIDRAVRHVSMIERSHEDDLVTLAAKLGDLDELVAMRWPRGWLPPTVEGRLTTPSSVFSVRKPRLCTAA